MGLFQRFERTKRLDALIRTRATGSPEALARRLGVSQATVYRWLQELKEFGLPVKYCRRRKTYLYEKNKPPE
ncbi:MAG: helix-turn-helix domain-containing protein [Saprospirales bacterium]|jgi:transposase|nr:helix-turn-helix domain-containing protein [Saprospirales bacterium]MBK6902546.1 helix-turn-helix domain-containing protein [Saprospirales bacterium]MBK7335678.1 helix-turn-helix domain-containing protein [Saprospirales bacterium]